MKRLLKWIGYTLAGIAAIVIMFVAVIYAITSFRMGKIYPTEVEAVTIPADSAAIERGRHLVVAVGKCTECHGDNLGGQVVADDPVFARLSASNLTRGKGASEPPTVTPTTSAPSATEYGAMASR